MLGETPGDTDVSSDERGADDPPPERESVKESFARGLERNGRWARETAEDRKRRIEAGEWPLKGIDYPTTPKAPRG